MIYNDKDKMFGPKIVCDLVMRLDKILDLAVQ